jgi:ribonuclease HII
VIPGLTASNLSVWKGDQVALSISAASILAKVFRDRIMIEIDKQYPNYGFASHKGYITPLHTESIKKYGVLPIHRKSFSNIADLMDNR